MSLRLFLACGALLGLTLWQEAARPARELELEYLANEGFLLRAGGRAWLLDAFVTEPYAGYEAVPSELYQRLCTGAPGYERIELALASHGHRDHFQPTAAATFLGAHAETRFVAAPEVLEALRGTLPAEFEAARLVARLPPDAQRLTDTELGLELVRLPHAGGARNASVQHLGLVLTAGGVRVLHVGDAEREAEVLAGLGLARLALDVACVPYWWLDDAAGLARVRTLTGARELVAMHVPPKERAEVQAHLAALDARIVLFEHPGERRRLRFD